MLKENQSTEFKIVITPDDLASTLKLSSGENFPEVLATSKMIAYMEVAAAKMMVDLLQPGELSVGVDVNIRHLAATPVNEEIKTLATFLKTEGKLYHFHVEAFDRGGKIGEGTHTRAIVFSDRLTAGADKRLNAAI